MLLNCMPWQIGLVKAKMALNGRSTETRFKPPLSHTHADQKQCGENRVTTCLQTPRFQTTWTIHLQCHLEYKSRSVSQNKT